MENKTSEYIGRSVAMKYQKIMDICDIVKFTDGCLRFDPRTTRGCFNRSASELDETLIDLSIEEYAEYRAKHDILNRAKLQDMATIARIMGDHWAEPEHPEP